jgi:uncharacterized protein
MKQIALLLLKFYKYTVSPLLPPSCRFTPSCSEYMAEAITRYGVWQGGWRGCKRLMRCHPFSAGGYDPVN